MKHIFILIQNGKYYQLQVVNLLKYEYNSMVYLCLGVDLLNSDNVHEKQYHTYDKLNQLLLSQD